MDAKITELRKIATDIRLGAVTAVHSAKSGHPGGALSSADILACLYFSQMRINPANPQDPDRDRFVLSKGHCSPALYSVLAHRGFFPVEDLKTFRKTTSYLQGHPDMKIIPGVDMSAGSLGLGISSACGMALAAKVDKKDYRVYTIVGDGESEEGQVWEAAMFAAHNKLSNLIAITDWNGQQIDGTVDSVLGVGDLEAKWKAFGWNVIVADGHNMEAILGAFKQAKENGAKEQKPVMILMKTNMGKGVDFMEGTCEWHGKAPKPELAEKALAQLQETLGDY